MKKSKFLIAAVAALTLVACNNPKTNDEYEVNILAPKGAPALAFYDMANDSNFVTESSKHMKEQFGQKNYGMIVMEFYTGLRTIKESHSNYRLARILTGGNLYLVSRSGKTTEPSASDHVMAFGPGGLNGIPYLSVRKLFPEVKPENIDMVEDGSAVKGALVGGKYTNTNNEEITGVDYVVIPQPALAGALKEIKDKNIPVTPKVITSLRDKAASISNNEQKWVLQAGLFVHKDLYESHKEAFETKLAEVDSNIDDILNNPEKVKTVIEEQLPNVAQQKDKFSCPTPMIPAVSKNPKMPNGFGFISASEYKETVNVQSFLSFVGRSGEENDFSSYMLTR